MSREAAYAALDAQIERLRTLADFAKTAAPLVAEAMKKKLDVQVLQGLGPDGKPWRRNADASISLAGAARAIAVTAIGTVIQAKVGYPFSFHNSGNTRGGTRRQIIPTNTLTAPLTESVKEVLDAHFKKTMVAGDGG